MVPGGVALHSRPQREHVYRPHLRGGRRRAEPRRHPAGIYRSGSKGSCFALLEVKCTVVVVIQPYVLHHVKIRCMGDFSKIWIRDLEEEVVYEMRPD